MPFLKMKPIVPKLFKAGIFQDELMKGLKTTETRLADQFGRTHRTWRTNIQFNRGRINSPVGIATEVSTADPTYIIVNQGARSHPIRPRGPWRLRYQKNFRSKTRPGVISSRAGGKFGPYVGRRSVRHPGHAPRYFDVEIAFREYPRFIDRAVKALEIGVRRSRHAI